MIYRVLADATLALHLAFILFVVFGGFLAWRWRWIAWVHVPAAVWGVFISLIGWTCPLTPVENRLRRLGGEAGYQESFIEHYLVSVIYPSDLTRTHFVMLGFFVLGLNVCVYGWMLYRRPTPNRLPS